MLVEDKWETHVLCAPTFSFMKNPITTMSTNKGKLETNFTFDFVCNRNCSFAAKPKWNQPMFSSYSIVIMCDENKFSWQIYQWPIDCSIKGTFVRFAEYRTVQCWVMLASPVKLGTGLLSNVLATTKLSKQSCVCFIKSATWGVWSSCGEKEQALGCSFSALQTLAFGTQQLFIKSLG